MALQMAPQNFQTKFIRFNVLQSGFLVDKLKLQILPAVIAFIDGVVTPRGRYIQHVLPLVPAGPRASGPRGAFRSLQLAAWLYTNAGGGGGLALTWLLKAEVPIVAAYCMGLVTAFGRPQDHRL
jgi:hypothetical protein